MIVLSAWKLASRASSTRPNCSSVQRMQARGTHERTLPTWRYCSSASKNGAAGMTTSSLQAPWRQQAGLPSRRP